MRGLDIKICRKLKNFDLDIKMRMESGTLGILGSSGCGKSMTLKMIAGITAPDSGRIAYGEKVFYDSHKRINIPVQKRNVGYLFQSYALFPNMTVYQNVAAGFRGKKKNSRESTEKLLAKFQLEDLRDQYPGHLSGGQQQRTALARIINSEPEILFLDEPFSAMDSFLKEELQIELKEFLKEFQHLTVIVSHNRDEIYQLCDHTMVMQDGKNVICKETKKLFEQPEYFAAARLTGCKNMSRARKIGPHLVEAVDFGITMKTEKEVPDDIRYVGVRAHDFVPAGDSDKTVNYYPVRVLEVTEAPFEWIILLKCEAGKPMWMKIPKNIGDRLDARQMPEYMQIRPDKILLLR